MMKLCNSPASMLIKLVWYNNSKQCVCIYKCETPSIPLSTERMGFLLVEALPQALVNAVFQTAATRF